MSYKIFRKYLENVKKISSHSNHFDARLELQGWGLVFDFQDNFGFWDPLFSHFGYILHNAEPSGETEFIQLHEGSTSANQLAAKVS